MKKKTRVVLQLEGGLIQHIASDNDIDIVILDGDIEGSDDTATIRMPAFGSCKEEWVEVFRPGISNPDVIDSSYVGEIFRQVEHCNEDD